ncbi:hypothetical protein HZA99_00680 [Candidatus Woesearchaeota archaeon]|nr:hypothetical protein [Candidatus Woesearchaeota archaeon]
MEKDNKEIVFEIITVIAAVLGVYFGNEYLFITALVSIFIALWFWYNENIVDPLKVVAMETKELRKDLNMRKEIEELKVQMFQLKMTQSKKAGINPFLFIILVLLLIMVVLYLKEKGFI